MTPIDLIIKDYLRTFLEGEMNAAARKQASPMPAIIVPKNQLEKFLDEMWVAINKSAQTHEE